jgi:hypothetical protein
MAIDGRLEPYREVEFPNLVATGYRVTSPTSKDYNCFAWAVGEDDRYGRSLTIAGWLGCWGWGDRLL